MTLNTEFDGRESKLDSTQDNNFYNNNISQDNKEHPRDTYAIEEVYDDQHELSGEFKKIHVE